MALDKYCDRCGKRLSKLYSYDWKNPKKFIGWLECECKGTKQKVLRNRGDE